MTSARKRRKRSLILAGGGLKVAFQAGVLQVWLDECGVTFDHVDGASGGCLNMAMLCQGMSGTRIADNWRDTSALAMATPNLREYPKLFYAESLFTLDGFRRNVLPRWGLDWKTIRASRLAATFNVYNVTRQELEVVTPRRMSEDYLIACVSLPMWFPPVRTNGNTYIDAVYVTDANVEEAIRRGADEIWAIWTVSERGEWHTGFVADYFQIIESSANGHFKRIARRIEQSNAAIAAGRDGEFGRRIDLKVLRAEVPINYLTNIGSDRLHEVVNRGVEAARRWCAERGIRTAVPAARPARSGSAALRFGEEMTGSVALVDGRRRRGADAGAEEPLAVRLTIDTEDIDRFVTDPHHHARVSGEVVCPALGGSLPIDDGAFNLLVDDGDPTRKEMRYRLHFHDGEGRPLTLAGVKTVRGESLRHLWRETTTLHTSVVRGHREAGTDGVVATGVLRLHPLAFARELATFRTTGSSVRDHAEAVVRFGTLFVGKLWDVYARGLLSYGPF
ncbi:patatin-like phospholipase family protein [Gandjariella thermophila]|uniref:PNPLA domain-containing protein n=1 Tax=Gandjariella thermophila TaxID=1931992 RepID=A0A4D4J3I3_9PSEU|nr:patatin-like phospholipase family protein [Gandjariella thermophila]GDY28543.1 hypothetical protein GTS_01760 [Gandjariella thermophila]